MVVGDPGTRTEIEQVNSTAEARHSASKRRSRERVEEIGAGRENSVGSPMTVTEPGARLNRRSGPGLDASAGGTYPPMLRPLTTAGAPTDAARR